MRANDSVYWRDDTWKLNDIKNWGTCVSEITGFAILYVMYYFRRLLHQDRLS